MGSRALALESLEQTLSVTTDAKQNHQTPHRHSPDRHDDPSMTTPRFACETFAQPRGLFHVKSPFPRDVIDDIEARIAREGWLLQQQAHRFSPLPAWLVEFSAHLKALALECGVITDREGGLLDFTQCIVNQYDAGDGLKPHVDFRRLASSSYPSPWISDPSKTTTTIMTVSLERPTRTSPFDSTQATCYSCEPTRDFVGRTASPPDALTNSRHPTAASSASSDVTG